MDAFVLLAKKKNTVLSRYVVNYVRSIEYIIGPTYIYRQKPSVVYLHTTK
jgi:hypothetical protein